MVSVVSMNVMCCNHIYSRCTIKKRMARFEQVPEILDLNPSCCQHFPEIFKKIITQSIICQISWFKVQCGAKLCVLMIGNQIISEIAHLRFRNIRDMCSGHVGCNVHSSLKNSIKIRIDCDL